VNRAQDRAADLGKSGECFPVNPEQDGGNAMSNVNDLQPGQRVRVIDPEDGYYLQEGEVEEVQGRTVYVSFGEDDTGQRFKPAQLKVVTTEES
jgi:hypothetical protein